MTLFTQSGNEFFPIQGTSISPLERLPVGTYVLKNQMFKGFFLEQISNFTLPKKIYGKSTQYAERILNTFSHRGKNTGALFIGEKGSGKSMLAKQICVLSNLPVIVINSPFCGDEFNTFLGMINQRVIVLFDEFEKVYDREHQNQVLTLFDGTMESNKLFILTCNNKWDLNDYLYNRPGRIFYHIEFKGVDEEFITEYCEDNLFDRSFTKDIVDISKSYNNFNFDLLSAFVEEINRYGEAPKDFVDVLNAKPSHGGDDNYVCTITYQNQRSREYVVSNFNPYYENADIEIPVLIHDTREVGEVDKKDVSVLEDLLTKGKASLTSENSKVAFIRNKLDQKAKGNDEVEFQDVIEFKINLDPEMLSFDQGSGKMCYLITDNIKAPLKRTVERDRFYAR